MNRLNQKVVLALAATSSDTIISHFKKTIGKSTDGVRSVP